VQSVPQWRPLAGNRAGCILYSPEDTQWHMHGPNNTSFGPCMRTVCLSLLLRIPSISEGRHSAAVPDCFGSSRGISYPTLPRLCQTSEWPCASEAPLDGPKRHLLYRLY
jgi:hypothetical protein